MKKEIIIDIGSYNIKYGIAGVKTPNLLRSFFGILKKNPKIIPNEEMYEKTDYFGEDAVLNKNFLDLFCPIKSGVIVDFENATKIFKIIFQELKIDPKEHKFIISAPPSIEKNERKKLIQYFFETLEVKSLCVANSAVLSVFGTGRTTGLVIDSGYCCTDFVPIYEGVFIKSGFRSMKIGGKLITVSLRRYMAERGYEFDSEEEKIILNNIKEDMCFVSENYEKDFYRYELGGYPEYEYELPDGSKITIDSERFRATEIMFNPSFAGEEFPGIHQNIVDSIQKSNLGDRSVLYGNIILCGGNSMFRGFRKRIKNEVETLSPLGTKINFVKLKNRKYSVFVGASIVGCLSKTFGKDIFISRKEYKEICEEYGPNWDYFNHKCYYLQTEKQTWIEAEENCQLKSFESHLTSVLSLEEENFFAEKYELNERFWIGLTDLTFRTRDYYWIDNSRLNYNNWCYSPLDIGECAFFDDCGWGTTNCDYFRYQYKSICKRKYYECNGIYKTMPNVCEGHGECIDFDTCLCNSSYYGIFCEQFDCDMIIQGSLDECNSNGVCVAPEICSCYSGYFGEYCQNWNCSFIEKDDLSVCVNMGECIEPDECLCEDGYYGFQCEKWDCYNFFYSNSSVCNSNGVCLNPNNCSCFEGYYEASCDSWNCSGVLNNNSNVCFGNGKCVSPQTCVCKRGYYSSNCEKWDCNRLEKSDENICSQKGNCVKPEVCSCFDGYYGRNCENHDCFSVFYSDIGVCSERGTCVAPNDCTCEGKYFSERCEKWNCSNILSSSPSVCSTKGNCSTPDNCICNKGYSGNDCEKWDCYSVPSTNENVCSTNGTCISPNNCSCFNGFVGNECQNWFCFDVEFSEDISCTKNGSCVAPNDCVCDLGYFSEDCTEWGCFKRERNEDDVCNSRGICVGINECNCTNENYEGKNCDIPICRSNYSKICLEDNFFSKNASNWKNVQTFELSSKCGSYSNLSNAATFFSEISRNLTSQKISHFSGLRHVEQVSLTFWISIGYLPFCKIIKY